MKRKKTKSKKVFEFILPTQEIAELEARIKKLNWAIEQRDNEITHLNFIIVSQAQRIEHQEDGGEKAMREYREQSKKPRKRNAY